MSNVFKDLSSIDVSAHLEEKSGLSYLQWMAAWAIVKDYDATATYKVHEDFNGNPFFATDAGAFVKTTVTIKGQELTEVLPVIDFRNKPITGEKLMVFDINSAYKRCLVKTLAMHGLGAQVYIDGNGSPLDLSKGLSKKKAAPKAAPRKPAAKASAATRSASF